MNAPRTWPKSSASSSVSGIALQLSATKRCCRRGLVRWIARATISLPVPVSPLIRIVVVVGATVSINWKSARMRGLRPIIDAEAEPLIELLAQVRVLVLQSPLLERRAQRRASTRRTETAW